MSWIKTNARKYLNNTDWYVIREMNNGIPMPDNVKLEREKCRKVL